MPELFQDKYVKKTWEHKGIQCAIRYIDYFKHYCGYIAVSPEVAATLGDTSMGPDLGVTDTGGVTYHQEDDGLEVLGFDCGHLWQTKNHRFEDISYIENLVNQWADWAALKMEEIRSD